MAVSKVYLSQWPHALELFHMAINMFSKIGDLYNIAFTSNNLGDLLFKQGDFDTAVSYFENALSILKQIGHASFALGSLHLNIGHLYIRTNALLKAESHLQLSQHHFEQTQAQRFYPELYSVMAKLKLAQDDLKQASEYAHKSLTWARKLNTLLEEGVTLRILGKMSTESGEYEEAKAYLERSQSILQIVKDDFEWACTLLQYADLCQRTAQFDMAHQFLLQCEQVFNRLGTLPELNKIADLRTRLSIATEDTSNQS